MTATERLRKTIERPRSVSHWGTVETITPRFVAAKLGNGKRLLRVTPLITRPNYYLIRVDDSIADLDGDAWRDYMLEIYKAIEDEYGECEREIENLMEEGKTLDEAHDLTGFPMLDLDCGTCWGIEPWPKGFAPKKRQPA